MSSTNSTNTSNNANPSELLTKLTRMEDQVSMLSLQLELNKETISVLKQSLSERDTYINELELKLATAQHLLQKSAIDKIYECRDQIKQGIDQKLVNPALTQIQKYIEIIQSLVDETRDFIRRKKLLLNENFQATSNLVQQCPDHAIRYFERRVFDPASAMIEELTQLIVSNYKVFRESLDRHLVHPGQTVVERMIFIARELPSNGKVIWQTRVIDPALAYLGELPELARQLWARVMSWINKIITQIRQGVEQCADFLAEQVKKSPFWDGKNRMAASY